MKALEAMIAWNPVSIDIPGKIPGEIRVGPWPDDKGWSDNHIMTMGACLLSRHKLPAETVALLVLADFHSCVVRDGIDPLKAHAEFLKIDEYRARISPDSPGLSDYPEG